jgi:DNA-binding CsgD family transcriptional regulator
VAILRSVVDILTDARPGIWVASLTARDLSVVSVPTLDERSAALAEYLHDRQRRGLLSSAPVVARVAESGEPVFHPSIGVSDLVQRLMGDPRMSDLESHRLPAEIRVLIVPMRAGGATVGSLGVYLAGQPAEVTEGDIAWLQVVADGAGLAIDHARVAEDARHHLLRLTGLGNLAHAVASTHDLSMVLGIIVDRVTAIARIDACDVLLIDGEDGAFRTAANRGFRSTSVGDFRLSADNPLLNQALNSRRVEYLRSAGVLDHARRRSVFVREGFVAYAAWPFVSQGRLLGALEVFHRSDLSVNMESALFISCVADMGATAVHMSRPREPADRAHRMGHSVNLGETDRRVLQLLVEGLTNSEIGARLHLSTNTIKFHVRQMLDRSGAANRTDLTRRAIREGWV